MSVCSVFCVFGFINILLNGHKMKEVKCEDAAELEFAPVPPQQDAATVEGDTKQIEPSQELPRPAKQVVSWGSLVTFFTVTFVLVFQAAGLTVVKTLWPLYSSIQFGWEDHAFAWLSLAGSLVSILTVCMLPVFALRIGETAVATLLCAVAAAGVLAGFPAKAGFITHLFGALAFIASTAALRPCLEALASLAVPQNLQGRSFAALKLANALGEMLGNYAGTRLYTMSIESQAPSLLPLWLAQTSGGSLPFITVGITLFLSTTVLAVTLLPQPWGAQAVASGANTGEMSSKGLRKRAAKT